MISATNAMLILLKEARNTYKDSLDLTIEALNNQQKAFFVDTRRIVADLENGVPQTVGTYTVAATRSILGSDRTPLVLFYDAQTLVNKNSASEVEIDGISFENSEFTIDWDGSSEVLTDIGPKIELSLTPDPDFEPSGWNETLPVRFNFSYRSWWGAIWRSNVSYEGHVRVIDPSQLDVRLVYNYTENTREFGPMITKRKDQGRVGHSWSHRLDVVPPSGSFIDVDSVRVTDWWEHDECDNGYTKYTMEEITPNYIRASMVGREQGGWDRDCGARFIYQYRTYTVAPVTRKAVSEPIELSGLEYRATIPELPNSRFSHFQVTPTGKTPFSISLDSTPWKFMTALASDGRSYVLLID